MHHFRAVHDYKINDCGFKFSVACKWCVLIKEDKDNSLQSQQSLSHQIPKVTNLAKFPPATILHYTVHTHIPSTVIVVAAVSLLR